MKTKNIKKLRIGWKRGVSALLAVATFCTAMVFAPIPSVEAADAYYVNFVDNITGKLTEQTSLLEGQTISTQMALPPGYSLNTSKPFEITNNDDGTTEDLIKTSTDGKIQAVEPTKLPDKGYNVKSNFNVFLKETKFGTLEAIYPNPNDPDETLAATMGFTTEVIEGRVSITRGSTIQFKVKNDMTDDKRIAFEFIGADNDLAQIFPTNGEGTQVNFIEQKDGSIYLDVVGVGNNMMRLKITCASMPATLKAGSKFSIRFPVEAVNDLQLTIISKKKAIDEISSDLANDNSFDKFVTLDKGDTRYEITKGFSLKHLEKRYNYLKGFEIDWEWKPNDIKHKSALDIKGNEYLASWQATPVLALEDVRGELVATVSIKDSTGITITETVSIPIMLLGLGVKPSFEPQHAYAGKVEDSGEYKIISTPLNGDFPKIMDVNDGKSADFPSAYPYHFTAQVKFGNGLARAAYAIIDCPAGFSGKISIHPDNMPEEYVLGNKLENKADVGSEAPRSLHIYAKEPGRPRIEIKFYNDKGTEILDTEVGKFIVIEDSSPNKDASFKSIDIKGFMPDGEITINDPVTNDPVDVTAQYAEQFKTYFGSSGAIKEPFYKFDSATRTYDITLPWAVESVELTPKYTSKDSQKGSIIYDAINKPITGQGEADDKTNITLTDGETKKITVNGVAQDGRTNSEYRINIHRQPRDGVAALTELSIKTSDGKTQAFTPAFDPKTDTYTLELPYSYRSKIDADGKASVAATVSATSQGGWGMKPRFSGDAVFEPDFMLRIANLFNGNKADTKIKLIYDVDADGVVTNENTVIVAAVSEDGNKKMLYTLKITILDPSRNTALSTLNVLDKSEKPLPFIGNVTFNKKTKEYYVSIPFKTDAVQFQVMPDDEKSQKIKVTHPGIYNPDGAAQTEPVEKEHLYRKKNEPLPLRMKIPYFPASHDASSKFSYVFDVQAESDQWTSEYDNEPYTVHFERLPANDDGRLKSLDVVNIVDKKSPESYQFIQSKFDYTFTVPYTTEELVITPVATKPDLSEVSVNGTVLNENRLNHNVLLVAGKSNKIVVEVVPESGVKDKKVYTLNITREAPAVEARLQSLVVNGGEKMLPDIFVPATVNYTVQIPEGKKDYTVTATPVDPNSTITVNGKATVNGQPSAPIISTEARSTITVVVTAQDGKTTKTYTIRVTDYNLIKKSSNADLSDVQLYYADISPSFKSGTDAYEVYLKPQATAFEITPVKAHSNATMTVTVGTKELKSYGGKYNTSLFGKKTTVTIALTSEDGKAERTYTFDVYKDTKNKEGSFKPITSEMVDYSAADPIVIDISNYAVVDASVFNTLKTEYPDKTIIFSGNDYMLRIKGSDITELVPHTTQYDLFFSFTTPDQSVIDGMLLGSSSANDWAEKPVYMHFNDHGSLPGQMILTVSLGGKYKNSTLFWNYYNPERARIDYYGYVQSNAKGTITVPLAHMSTYLVTTRKLVVSEDKTSTGFGSFENGSHTGTGSGNITEGSGNAGDNISGGISPDKKIPQTGVGTGSEEVS